MRDNKMLRKLDTLSKNKLLFLSEIRKIDQNPNSSLETIRHNLAKAIHKKDYQVLNNKFVRNLLINEFLNMMIKEDHKMLLNNVIEKQ